MTCTVLGGNLTVLFIYYFIVLFNLSVVSGQLHQSVADPGISGGGMNGRFARVREGVSTSRMGVRGYNP